jgi:hypothetical protein
MPHTSTPAHLSVITDQGSSSSEGVPLIHLRKHAHQSSALCLVTGIPKQGIRSCISHFRDYEDYEPAEEVNKLAGIEAVDAEEMTVKVDIALDFGRQGMESGTVDMVAVLREHNHRHALVVPTIGQ